MPVRFSQTLCCAVALAVPLFALSASPAFSAVYWYPPGSPIQNEGGRLVLVPPSGATRFIECNSWMSGKTPGTSYPPKTEDRLWATLKVSNCEASAAFSMATVTAIGPTGSPTPEISFKAETPTFTPQYGGAIGDGMVTIPQSVKYEFKYVLPKMAECTYKVHYDSSSIAIQKGFTLHVEWWQSVLKINRIPVPVQVVASGPYASLCGPSGTWFLDTQYFVTSPHLEILGSQ